jgi:membrane protein YqaA with SNARE-associated domain
MKDEGWLSGWRLTLVRALSLAAVIAISIYIFSIRNEVEALQAYGYPGIFLLSILANATVLLPAPGVALTFTFGAVFHPLGVAIAAGLGAALGELTGYAAGFSGRGLMEGGETHARIERWTDRYGSLTILVLAFVPNPLFDLAGAAAGAVGMPLGQFLFWACIGKILKMLMFAYAGAMSME